MCKEDCLLGGSREGGRDVGTDVFDVEYVLLGEYMYLRPVYLIFNILYLLLSDLICLSTCMFCQPVPTYCSTLVEGLESHTTLLLVFME